jgi:HK97 family phage prohead protease
MEKRYALSGVSIEGRKLIGLGVPYNKPSRVIRENRRTFIERIMPGTFEKVLAEKHDVLFLADHDMAKVLGRTRSGTLQLQDTREGLRFAVDLPDTQAARDALALAARGDLGGASINFIATRETWNANKTERTVHEARLIEISVISSFPAYATPVEARALTDTQPLTARQRRLRLIELGGSQ